jgi:hypothetical protein
MADSHTSAPQPAGPVTVDAFLADRQRVYSSFTHFGTVAASIVTVVLVLMAIFLL